MRVKVYSLKRNIAALYTQWDKLIGRNVEDKLSSDGFKNIVRTGGKDRFATSLDVTKYFGLSGSIECAASDSNFPDALSGSIYAAEN